MGGRINVVRADDNPRPYCLDDDRRRVAVVAAVADAARRTFVDISPARCCRGGHGDARRRRTEQQPLYSLNETGVGVALVTERAPAGGGCDANR